MNFNMKLKIFIAMGLLSMFGLDSCNAQQKDNTAKKELHYTMNESAPKNYYLLTMSSNGCNFRILVNDIPVYGFWDEGAYKKKTTDCVTKSKACKPVRKRCTGNCAGYVMNKGLSEKYT